MHVAKVGTVISDHEPAGTQDVEDAIKGMVPRSTVLLALPILFNLWFLRAENRVVENVNGGSVHAALIRWASHRFSSGRIPLDGWFPFLTTGSPLIHNQEGLPHIVAGLFGAAVGGNTAYAWSNYLLMGLWPISVYIGARLLGWRQSSALAAAVVSPLVAARPGYGYEFSSYTFAGLGLWTQLCAMWLLPPTLGLTWRAINDKSKLLVPTLALSFTIMCHLTTGYFALLAVGVWVIVHYSAGFVRLAGRGIALGGVALVAASWMLLPLISDGRWAVNDGFTNGTFWHNSFGLAREVGWLLSGQLFDGGATGTRLPIITLLVLIGIAICVVRFQRDARARALLGLWILSMVLFAGPATFGFILNRLPGSHGLLFHRYIFAVHMTGILLAGVAGGWLFGMARIFVKRATRLKPAPAAVVVVAMAALLLAPAWSERANYASASGALIQTQQTKRILYGTPREDLIAIVNQLRGGRAYSGLPTNWGRLNIVGYIPGYISLLNHDIDAIGFTLRPVRNTIAGVEPYLNENDIRQLDAFGIRYLILPAGRLPPAGATRIDTQGSETLWSVPTSGYVAVVDTVESITADNTSAAPFVQFLSSPELHRGLYPTVAYNGAPAADPTAHSAFPPRGSPGSVTPVQYQPSDGVFQAGVKATRDSAVVLKSAYTGRWRVLVDGQVADKYMVAPGYPAVTVSAGAHTVEFRYMPFSGYPLCFALGAFALLALVLPRRARARIRASTVNRTARRRVRSSQFEGPNAPTGPLRSETEPK